MDSLARRYVRSPRVLWRETCTGAVVLPPAADEPVVLNGSATALWHLLAEPADLTELCDEVADMFGQDPQVIRPEISAILAELQARCAIQGDRL